MCLDFHPQHPSLLAVGCYDGTVMVFDVRRKANRPIYTSSIKTGKHTDPVTQPNHASPPNLTPCGVHSLLALLAYAERACPCRCWGQVWRVHWQKEDFAKELNFYSISSDGRVASWIMSKNELKMEPVMQLKLVSTVKVGLQARSSEGRVHTFCLSGWHALEPA